MRRRRKKKREQQVDKTFKFLLNKLYDKICIPDQTNNNYNTNENKFNNNVCDFKTRGR